MLAITDVCNVKMSIHVPYVCAGVFRCKIFSTSAFANSFTFEDIFSLSRTGSNKVVLQYFNDMTTEELKFAARFTESLIFNPHHVRETYGQ